MLISRTRLALITLSTLVSTNLFAQSLEHHIVAPTCLLKNMQGSYKRLAENHSLVLISTDDAGITQLMLAKDNTKTLCGGFIDVSRAWENQSAAISAQNFLNKYATPAALKLQQPVYKIQYQAQVLDLFTQINPQNMWDNLTTFTQFKNRFADSQTGVKAEKWLQTEVETYAQNSGRNDVTIYTVATDFKFKQPSLVLKVGDSSEPGIVIGAHMDSVQGVSPGADDDGTGSMTVLEVARTILASGMHFKKPLYFIWYSAEEEGLVGSEHVVADFSAKNIPVAGVIQFDLTGYAFKNQTTMWLIDDNVNKSLSSFLGDLMTTYVNREVKHTQCGYACSDHATWTQEGYVAAMPAESAFKKTNPNIHTPNDTIDKLSLDHMTDYLKLGTAFAVEMAEPTSA